MTAKKINEKKFSELRSLYHSLNSDERFLALNQLAELKNSDSNRELIHIFNECQWRETKFQVIQVLATFPDHRALEFLIQLSCQTMDLPIAEAAIKSLGESKNKTAARFLNQYFKVGPQALKPSVVLALGRIPDGTLIDDFIEALPQAYQEQEYMLVKNLILTLGELKAQRAQPFLLEIAKNKQHRDLALSAIVSLGKIARDPSILFELDTYFKKDSFEHQIFINTKNQIQFRSHWKMEDYIQKMIQTKTFHLSMYLELNQFSAEDVKAALDLLSEEKHLVLLFELLPRLYFKELAGWYKQFVSQHKDERPDLVLNSVFNCESNEIKKTTLDHFNKNDQLFYETQLTNSEMIESVICQIFEDVKLPEENSHRFIQIVNSIYNQCLVLQANTKKSLSIGKAIEQALIQNTHLADYPHLVGRIYRLLGDIQYRSSKLTHLIEDSLFDHRLHDSAVYYMQRCPSDYFFNVVVNYIEKGQPTPKDTFKNLNSFLKFFLTGLRNPFLEKKLETFFTLCFEEPTVQVLLLKLIQKFPVVAYKNKALLALQSLDEMAQLHAIMALKSYKDETITDQVVPLLKSSSHSISGHALDLLLGLPGNRAKRVVIDYLAENSSNSDVVAKIVRCFIPVENETDYFANVVAGIIKKDPEHQLIEELRDFHDKLMTVQRSFKSGANQIPTAVDLVAIDSELEKVISSYRFYDEASKAALRSAEIPFRYPSLYDRFVDKSSIVIGYSKAIDIILEKQLGRQFLFSRFENRIHEFQNTIHGLTLNEDYPNTEKVLKLSGLDKHFTTHSFPMHKAVTLCQGIMSGKIINDHFKLLDGLRAWSILFMLFGRSHPVQSKPLFQSFEDESLCIQFCKKLIWLQEVRNPIAHRQTVVEFKTVEEARAEVFQILKLIDKLNLFRGLL